MIRAYYAKKWELSRIFDNKKTTHRFIAKEKRGKIQPLRFQVGDILYVTENFRLSNPMGEVSNNTRIATCEYELDGFSKTVNITEKLERLLSNRMYKGVSMPKELSRCFLKVDRIRLEYLQDITEEDAIKEGVQRLYDNISDEEYNNWSHKVCDGKKKEDWDFMNYLWHGNYGSCGGGNWKTDLWNYQYSSYDSPIGSFSSLWNSFLSKDELKFYGWDLNPKVWVVDFHICNAEELKELKM